MASPSQITLEIKNGRISVESNLDTLFMIDHGEGFVIERDGMEIQIEHKYRRDS